MWGSRDLRVSDERSAGAGIAVDCEQEWLYLQCTRVKLVDFRITENCAVWVDFGLC